MTPTTMPMMVTVRLPNLLANGTTSAAATAMGMAPSTASRDWDAPQASAEPKKVLSSTHLQKKAMEPFFMAPLHWKPM